MEIFFKSVNIWQSYKQNRDYLVIILKGGESRGGEKREGVHALPSEEKRKLGAYESMDKQSTDLWFDCLQCFEAVGWAAGRASGL